MTVDASKLSNTLEWITTRYSFLKIKELLWIWKVILQKKLVTIIIIASFMICVIKQIQGTIRIIIEKYEILIACQWLSTTEICCKRLIYEFLNSITRKILKESFTNLQMSLKSPIRGIGLHFIYNNWTTAQLKYIRQDNVIKTKHTSKYLCEHVNLYK